MPSVDLSPSVYCVYSMHLRYIFFYFQNKSLLQFWKKGLNRKAVHNLRCADRQHLIKKSTLCSGEIETLNEGLKENRRKCSSEKSFSIYVEKKTGSIEEKNVHLANEQYEKEEGANKNKRNEKERTNGSEHGTGDLNWERINQLVHFTKKIIICSCVIYIINNYLFDMTLTSGSSMYPLISKQGVVLFYVCNDALVGFNKLYKLYIDGSIVFWKMTHHTANFLFSKYSSSHYSDVIVKKMNQLIERGKRKAKVYNRGDVVILYSPVNNQKRVCKRIIAIENDRIYLNRPNVFVQIPERSVWVEGDNKEDSYDSRNYGSVPINMLIGRAFFLIDPFTKFGFIKNKNFTVDKNRFERLAD